LIILLSPGLIVTDYALFMSEGVSKLDRYFLRNDFFTWATTIFMWTLLPRYRHSTTW